MFGGMRGDSDHGLLVFPCLPDDSFPQSLCVSWLADWSAAWLAEWVAGWLLAPCPHAERARLVPKDSMSFPRALQGTMGYRSVCGALRG